ncbi:MAG TPA: hypothetical protein VMU87_15265 [Stellaceae bacterium]|nr:hypothetical protein [Stellaceae bacterium]
MGRWLMGAALAAMLAGCGTFDGSLPTDAARTAFGVSATQPGTSEYAAPTPQSLQTLHWKVAQTCTGGYALERQAVDPGQNGMQFADWQLRCRPYTFSVLGISFPERWWYPD